MMITGVGKTIGTDPAGNCSRRLIQAICSVGDTNGVRPVLLEGPTDGGGTGSYGVGFAGNIWECTTMAMKLVLLPVSTVNPFVDALEAESTKTALA
jgi:hypothetical protein